jgi:hypothetical protein
MQTARHGSHSTLAWGLLISLGTTLSCSSRPNGTASGGTTSSNVAGASGAKAEASAGTTNSAGSFSGGGGGGGGGGSGAVGGGSVDDGGGGGGGGNVAGAAQGGDAGNDGGRDYDSAVLADEPAGFWAVNRAPDEELDLTGHGHDGAYRGTGTPTPATLPNGDAALAFDGAEQYLTIPSSPSFSIPTTGDLTWEAWIRPDVLQFPSDDSTGSYVDWLGKCEQYGPTCEWEARLYNATNDQDRVSRFSAYAFNPGAGLGSGADWQPATGVIQAGGWYHVVGQYTTLHEPSDCDDTDSAPGSIDIWLNGVKWDHGSHGQTGCLSQYDVVPEANDSAVNVATMAKDSFFKGAIGKLAVYGHALTQAQIDNHYTLMTGKPPRGSCGNTCRF